jgi:hypothetical protein
MVVRDEMLERLFDDFGSHLYTDYEGTVTYETARQQTRS